jgi:ADP-Ribosyltransferase in polyvalent proteins
LKVSAKGESWRDIEYKGEFRDINELAEMIKRQKRYDGLIVTRVIDKGRGDVKNKTNTTYVAFNSSQIKSATGNDGTFGPSGDITKSFKDLMKEFDPSQPRGDDGRWIEKNEILAIASMRTDNRVKEISWLFDRVTDTEQRLNLVRTMAANGINQKDIQSGWRLNQSVARVVPKVASRIPVASFNDVKGHQVDAELAAMFANPKISEAKVVFENNSTDWESLDYDTQSRVMAEYSATNTGRPDDDRLLRFGLENGLIPYRATNEVASEVFGLHKQDIASVIGAPDDSVVIVSAKGGAELEIRVQHPDISIMDRTIRKDDDGNTFVKNEQLFIDPESRGGGLGLEIFTNQVANCKRLGIKYIAADLAKKTTGPESERMVGYNYWIRLGYASQVADIPNMQVREKVYEKFPDAQDVRDLMGTKTGRDWWKKNGVGLYNAVFDLSDNSRSLRMLGAFNVEKRGSLVKSFESVKKEFDSSQPRDEIGRWIDDPQSYAWALGRFGDSDIAYNFQKWFAGSKIVDESGSPLVVYHGTTKDFNTFSGGKDNIYAQSVGVSMFFFSGNPSMAESYPGLSDGANLKPVFLSMKNPLVINAKGSEWTETVGEVVDRLSTYRTDKERSFQEMRQQLADKYAYEYESNPEFVSPEESEFQLLHKDLERDILSGLYKDLPPVGVSHYDGIIIKNSFDWAASSINEDGPSFSPFGDVYIAFESSQIKSAIGNDGTFGPTGDITKSAKSKDSVVVDCQSQDVTGKENTDDAPIS